MLPSCNDEDSALVLRGVRKSYGEVTALAGVDLSIRRGEVVALLGRNGAGKTTLISIAAGLRRPDCGYVEVDGVPMRDRPSQARARLGLAAHETGVYLPLSVRENLRFFGELVGLGRREIGSRIEELSCALELDELLDRRTQTLSVGQLRRLHLAATIMRRPPLLLLDEPTTGVDVRSRGRILELVHELARAGSAVCYSTHYLVEAERLEASVAILHGGRLLACGSLARLIAAHGDSAVELIFDGPAPAPAKLPHVRLSKTTLRLSADDGRPGLALARALPALGDSVLRLRAAKVVQPSLESVFLTLTEQVPSVPAPARDTDAAPVA
jgi:ABC-2 type transport system ATP-binding protein